MVVLFSIKQEKSSLACFGSKRLGPKKPGRPLNSERAPRQLNNRLLIQLQLLRRESKYMYTDHLKQRFKMCLMSCARTGYMSICLNLILPQSRYTPLWYASRYAPISICPALNMPHLDKPQFRYAPLVIK